MSPREGESRGRGWLDVAAAGLLSGALAGAQLAGLLFFLNPALPFAAGPVLRGALAYGALLGGAGLLTTLPWTRGRPARARRLLPWGLFAAFAFAAALDWTHASYYAYYLPPGINERLIKAALWLSLAALIAFYTALLHSLGRRPYGPRSRWGLAFLALFSLYVVGERREAFHPRPVPAPRPTPAAPERAPSLVVVALEGATLDAILPLAGDGRLPFFATLLQGGAHGRLASLTPHRPAALWTTLATGKYPYEHGVTGEGTWTADLLAPGARLRLLPAGIGFRRWGTIFGFRRSPAAARTASTLWEILPRLGVPAGVVGWPASYPIHASLGVPAPGQAQAPVTLTDAFFAGREGAEAAQPPELAARARALRVAEREIDPALLARFGRTATGRLRRALAGDVWRESVAADLMDRPETIDRPEARALVLSLPGLEGVSVSSFGGFSVVEFEGARARIYREAAQRVTAYYQHLDELLAALWRRQERPAILAVVSAYGVEGPGRWRRLRGELSRQAAVGGSTAGSPDGVLILYGDGIRKGSLLTGMRLVDVLPTLLYAEGFPVAKDLDGQVLTAGFEREFLARTPLTFVSSYELSAANRSVDR